MRPIFPPMGPQPAGLVNIRLPRALLAYWSGPASLEVGGRTLAAAIDAVEAQHPGLGARILDDQGSVRQHVAVFINGEISVDRVAAQIPLRPGDRVQIVPAVSGG